MSSREKREQSGEGRGREGEGEKRKEREREGERGKGGRERCINKKKIKNKKGNKSMIPVTNYKILTFDF